MKTKKFAAVLAAAAMMASVIPMQAMAATPLTDGAGNYDFEDGTMPACVLPGMSLKNVKATAPDWSAEIVEDETGNKALKYTFNSQNGEIKRSTDESGALIRLDVSPSKWGTNKWFEYSYRYKMDTALNMTSKAFMTLTDSEFGGQMKSTYDNGKITVNNASVEPETGKWVTVKTTMYRSANVTSNRVTAARTTVSYENSEGETVTNVVSEVMKNAFSTNWGGVQRLGLSANTANLTDGDSFMIDDIKFSTLDDELITVSFDTNGGSDVTPVGTAFGKIDLNWVEVPEKQASIFGGWYKDQALTQPFDGTGITEDINVYAKWLDAYVLSFVPGEGVAAIDDMLVDKSVGSVHKLPFPQKEGYVFDGWYTDQDYTQLYDGRSVTEDKTLYAKWTESDYLYNVNFEGNAYPDDLEVIQLAGSNGHWSSGVEKDENGNSYMKYTRTHEGTTFVKGTILKFATIQFPNYATCNKNANLSTVPVPEGTGYEIGYKFKPNGSNFGRFMGLQAEMSYNLKSNISYWKCYNGTLTANCGDGTNNTAKESFSDYGDGFITVKIIIDPSGAVEKDENGKTVSGSTLGTGEQTIIYTNKSGETITKKMEFKFSKCDFRTSYTTKLALVDIQQDSDMGGDDSFCLDDIYAKPLAAKTVTFVTNDLDVTVAPVKTVTNEIKMPADIKKDGTMLVWYRDEEFTEPFDGTGITGDMAVHGRWETLYTVSFVTYGEEIAPIETIGAIDLSGIVPVNGLLVFDGWYEDEAYNVPFTATTVNKDTVLYAKWSNALYSADFESSITDYSGYNSTLDFFTNERVQEENGNYAMKYRYGKTEWTKTQHIFSYRIPVKMNQDGTIYDMSYKFKPTKGEILVPSLSLEGHYGRAKLFELDTNGGGTVGYNGKITGGDSQFIDYDIDGYVTVRAIVNPKDKKASVFITGRRTNGPEFRVSYEASDIKCVNSDTIDYFRISSSLIYAPTEGTEMLLDDVKLYVAKEHAVTFDYMDGRDDEVINANIDGKVELPIPTRENYQFVGWYKDQEFTLPFDGLGVFDDTTVYAFWQTVPTIERSEPADGSANISTTPTIKLYFDCRMDTDTLNTSSIKVYKGDLEIEPEYYTVQTSGENQNTVAAIQFTHALDLGCTYTVKVLTTAKNLCYNMAEEYSTNFTVKDLTLSVSDVTVTDENGNAVTSLQNNAGKKINVSFKITNNSDEDVNYTPILSVMKNGTLTEAAIGAGNSENVEIGLPENAEDTDELGLMVFDSIGGMKPLAGKTVIK